MSSTRRIYQGDLIVTRTVPGMDVGAYIKGAAVSITAFFALWVGIASATSVREASVDELIDQSEIIFEGTVTDVRSRKSGRGTIVTDVVFEVTDVVKGHIPQRRLKLEFLGGEVEGEALSVPAMDYPEVGEKGIYFAESVGQTLVNPLYGWDQGRFLIAPDETGTERVSTSSQRPVVSIGREQANFFATPEAEAKLSSGIARGVRATQSRATNGNRADDLGAAMSAGQFKQRIRDLMGDVR